ncbi:DNA-binding NtrC family response regulator [Sphingomonas endophytica]|uniref:DNA-binding NtrC family response regulator n=1 Tax=Sphingomonas endophytica TaxID=869719 RepID=A0A7X0MQC9_9SPHN|nr:hypothetical protein [Sphingomonas endophytica]MBB6505398.1 DNA-binding NtrC family response regulator [Sphingomonas endophytica]
MPGAAVGQCTLVGEPGAVLALAYGLARSPHAMLKVDAADVTAPTPTTQAEATQLSVKVTFDLGWATDRLRADTSGTSAPTIDPIETLIGRTLADIECDLTWRTLARCQGDRERAAMILGIPARRIGDTLRDMRPVGFAPTVWPALR